MVMADRAGVATAPAAITAIDTAGLAGQMLGALARVPFRAPWRGPSTWSANVGTAVTREVIRSFMGYSTSLPIEEFRSIERVLDGLCKVVMPPAVRAQDVTTEAATVNGVPGVWYRPRSTEPIATILYLHGGGYIGTSPTMYAAFTAGLARACSSEIFVADYRLAPEFPFPAGVEDATAVITGLVESGTDPARLLIAGDSGGGGLSCSVMYFLRQRDHPRVGGTILFSPEVYLGFDKPSIVENAPHDILPWNIPTQAYVLGTDVRSESVNALAQDVSGWPPTFITYGGKEMLRDQIEAFVAHLSEGGVDTESFVDPEMFHVFPIVAPWADSSRRLSGELARFVARVAGGGNPR